MPEFVFTFSLILLLALVHLGATWGSLGRRCTSPNMHFSDRKISLLCAANLRISIAQGDSLFRRAGCVPAARHATGAAAPPGPWSSYTSLEECTCAPQWKTFQIMGKVCWGLGRCVCAVWCQGEVGYNLGGYKLGGWCPEMWGTARVKPALLVLRERSWTNAGTMAEFHLLGNLSIHYKGFSAVV